MDCWRAGGVHVTKSDASVCWIKQVKFGVHDKGDDPSTDDAKWEAKDNGT